MASMMKKIMLYLVGALGLYMRATVASAAFPTAQQVASKWQTRTSNAAEDYANGVANTDKDPTQLAIAAGPRYLQNVQRAFNDGSWANGLRRAGKTGWQAGVAGKGRENFSRGVQAAEGKVAEAFAPLLAYEQNLLNQVNGMSNVSDADREARMLTWVRGMRQYKRS